MIFNTYWDGETMIPIKLCGITRRQDAELAVELGAAAIGIILAASPRRITPEQARIILKTVPPTVDKVGVFVNLSPAAIRPIAEQIGLTVVQLHGNESSAWVAELAQDYKTIKTVKLSMPGTECPAGTECPPDIAIYPGWRILLEPRVPGADGGTGQRFDWNLLDRIDLSRCLIGGGIRPDNLPELLDRFQSMNRIPAGIDVCSGVESAPGIKDPDKMKHLFSLIRDYVWPRNKDVESVNRDAP